MAKLLTFNQDFIGGRAWYRCILDEPEYILGLSTGKLLPGCYKKQTSQVRY